MHARTSTHIHTATQRRNKIPKKGRRNMIWDVFDCVLLLHYSVLPPPPHTHTPILCGRKQGDWSREWCDTLLRPLFCTTPANMQAHLKTKFNSLKTKAFQFFPTDQFTASPGLPVGLPKFQNLSSGNTQKPLSSDIFFQSQSGKKGRSEKALSRNV